MLEKNYEVQKYEQATIKKWLDSGLANPDKLPGERIESFSIILPPPNVTGKLHIGHSLMLALQDAFIRFNRMTGKKTLWLPGLDHAAIATQNVVEKELAVEGKTRHDLGREKFLERVNETVAKNKTTILQQCERMGASFDLSRLKYTLDDDVSKTVRQIFTQMYNDGLLYRGLRLVQWCPRCHSTLSDDEVRYTEERGKLYWIKYGPFVLATSRPETKLGDTAVAVHPHDPRYSEMIGKKYMIPGVLGEFEIEVVADEAVDRDFGTGAIKVTPAHSFVDYEIAQRHNLKMKQIIDEDGKMMSNCGKYAGMITKEAREAIVSDMEKMGLIDHIEENYLHNIGTCYRCGSVIEPLPSKQWFVAVGKPCERLHGKTLKEVTLDAVQNNFNGETIEILPDRFKKVYEHWINNLHDWCISRQLWFGHRLPVYYKGEEIFVGDAAPSAEWMQDEDVLDTWFSSGLWTFSTMGWDEKNPSADFKNFHPTSVLETAYDILFFWVARMIMLTTYATGQVPFHKVYLHGLVRDEQGRKLSKSLGNGIDPLEVCEKFGADAVRLSLTAGIGPGQDSKMSEKKIQGYRNFVNKLWNIGRFAQGAGLAVADKVEPKTPADYWILAELDTNLEIARDKMEKYDVSGAIETLRAFTWDSLADWYLETTKIEGFFDFGTLSSPSAQDDKAHKGVMLGFIMEKVLIAWHPLMPFVTEALWAELGFEKARGALMIQTWPSLSRHPEPDSGSRTFETIKDLIVRLRQIKHLVGKETEINYAVSLAKADDVIKNQLPIIEKLAGVKINFEENLTEALPVGAYAVAVAEMDLLKQKRSERKEELTKEIARLEKLLSSDFGQKADAEIITNEKSKLAGYKKELAELG